MVQWEKVIELHRILAASHGFRKRDDLTEQLHCSRATFYRLVDILRHVFEAPLDCSHRYHGYKYDLKDGKTFELPGLWFKTEELECLICLEAIASSLQKGYLTEAFSAFRVRLERLLKAQKITLANWRERFKVIPIASRKTDSRVFQKVAQAVLHRNQLEVDHQKLTKDKPDTRRISPQTLLRYRDNWYVDGWCHESNKLRTFALNRISRAEIKPGKAKQIPRQELDEFFGASYGIFTGPAVQTAEILFTGFAAKEIPQEEWHPKQQGEIRPDGNYVLRIPYSDSTELLMDILRWGENAQVLGPEPLRLEIERKIKKMSENYNSRAD
jgi:proteasome accessory factor C